jgi:hypothetical protein
MIPKLGAKLSELMTGEWLVTVGVPGEVGVDEPLLPPQAAMASAMTNVLANDFDFCMAPPIRGGERQRGAEYG